MTLGTPMKPSGTLSRGFQHFRARFLLAIPSAWVVLIFGAECKINVYLETIRYLAVSF